MKIKNRWKRYLTLKFKMTQIINIKIEDSGKKYILWRKIKYVQFQKSCNSYCWYHGVDDHGDFLHMNFISMHNASFFKPKYQASCCFNYVGEASKQE